MTEISKGSKQNVLLTFLRNNADRNFLMIYLIEHFSGTIAPMDLSRELATLVKRGLVTKTDNRYQFSKAADEIKSLMGVEDTVVESATEVKEAVVYTRFLEKKTSPENLPSLPFGSALRGTNSTPTLLIMYNDRENETGLTIAQIGTLAELSYMQVYHVLKRAVSSGMLTCISTPDGLKVYRWSFKFRYPFNSVSIEDSEWSKEAIISRMSERLEQIRSGTGTGNVSKKVSPSTVGERGKLLRSSLSRAVLLPLCANHDKWFSLDEIVKFSGKPEKDVLVALQTYFGAGYIAYKDSRYSWGSKYRYPFHSVLEQDNEFYHPLKNMGVEKRCNGSLGMLNVITPDVPDHSYVTTMPIVDGSSYTKFDTAIVKYDKQTLNDMEVEPLAVVNRLIDEAETRLNELKLVRKALGG